MPTKNQVETRRRTLVQLLEPAMKGVSVDVSATSRWNRPMVTVRWAGFSGLLAEQRFRRVMRCIPQDALERDFRGMVWFELTPGETVEDYLKMPRSEDVRAQAERLLTELRQKKFFDRLRALNAASDCGDDFTRVRKVLRALRYSVAQTERMCLAMLSLGRYCDCEVLELSAEP